LRQGAGALEQASAVMRRLYMTKLKKGQLTEEPDLERSVKRIDEDLEIMDRHAEDLADAESGIQDSMKKRDREHKDSCLHSISKSLKHNR
jgi:hypothetical protein